MDLNKLPGPIPESEMGKIILEEHPEGLVKVLVHGRERIGKSIWVIKVMWEIYEALGYGEDKAYEMALESLYFYPQKFLEQVDEIEQEVMEDFKAQAPTLCMDDAGVGLGGGLYDLNRDIYWELKETWPTMGVYTTGLFLTTPEPDDISEKFKGWAYRVKIIHRPEGGKYGRKALAYAEDTDALGIHRTARREGGFKEKFSCYLQNKWFTPYNKRRIQYRRKVKGLREKRREERA